MKLISIVTPGLQELKDNWFLPSLKQDCELCLHEADIMGDSSYMDPAWSLAVERKCQTIIQAIRDNPGDSFIYSDVDLEFFAPVSEDVRQALKGKDIVCQMDTPFGILCTGFFGIRANKRTLTLWEAVYQAILSERRDQPAFNRLIHSIEGLRAGALPLRFFGTGTFRRKRWEPGDRVYVPLSPALFHANWSVGVPHKIQLLHQVKSIVGRGRPGILANNLLYLAGCGTTFRTHLGKARSSSRTLGLPRPRNFAKPSKVCLETSTVCQLKCQTCPTANGEIGRDLGRGFLSLSKFNAFVEAHPWVTHIELSNWGEVFMNPELPEILESGRRHGLVLTLNNGVNLNTADDTALEAVVKHRLTSLKCSIDGASQATYSQYRVNGNFDRVMANLDKLNALKRRYNSPYPRLTWQFVAFGHNEHEIAAARARARDLNMSFQLKLSWDDLYGDAFSPIRNRDLIRNESGLNAADRQEYADKHHKGYIEATCHQLWLEPRINFDGRLLGCSINHAADFGNVFESGLEACLTGDKMNSTRRLLMGLPQNRADLPCLTCKVYQERVKYRSFVSPEHFPLD